jgi:hypothetical protein
MEMRITMRTTLRRLMASSVLFFFAAVLTGCASGQPYNQFAAQVTPVSKQQGRIYFYRDSSPFGSGVQPEIKLNDAVVGNSNPGGFFYVDRPSGNYTVSTQTEAKRNVNFTLSPGETKYVRTRVAMGVLVGHVYGELEDEETAMKTLKGLSYTGGKK